LYGLQRLVANAPVADPDIHYHLALSIARKQEAISFELRAATSLCRRQLMLNGTDAARAMLEEILSRFSDGAETLDILEARELLKS